MKRLFTAGLLAGLVGWSAAQDPPKKDDATKPKAEVEKKAEETDVQATADRIADNATKAGERLKDKNLGKDTRELQDQILKDIDALIKKSQNPPPPMPPENPPPKSDMPPPPPEGMPPPNGGMPPPKDGMNPGMPPPKRGTPSPKDGMNPGMPPPKTDGMGGGGQPPKKEGMGSGQPEPKKDGTRPGRRPRPNREPMGGQKEPKEPMGPMAKAEPKEGKEPGGMPPAPPISQLPKKNARPEQFAEMYKDVWGKLPDRVRQEMDLYYREQFMPRYGELLRQYYSSIAEQNKRGPGAK